jgi:hypothetical protein
MKKISVYLLLFFSVVYAREIPPTVSTDCFLPNNSLIFPTPKLDLTENIIVLNCEFQSSKTVFSYNEGNWRNEFLLITYKVISNNKLYAKSSMSFLVKDSWPAKGSNLRVKKLHLPFEMGRMVFYLEKVNNVTFKKYYKIITYQDEQLTKP